MTISVPKVYQQLDLLHERSLFCVCYWLRGSLNFKLKRVVKVVDYVSVVERQFYDVSKNNRNELSL